MKLQAAKTATTGLAHCSSTGSCTALQGNKEQHDMLFLQKA
jgi:hypothetical protein